MTTFQRNKIREMQTALLRIENKERFFFNLVAFKNMGLIKERDIYGKDSTGEKIRIRTEYLLTSKGKRCIEVIV